MPEHRLQKTRDAYRPLQSDEWLRGIQPERIEWTRADVIVALGWPPEPPDPLEPTTETPWAV